MTCPKSLVQDPCAASTNPRANGKCFRCHRPIPDPQPDVEPGTLERDLRHEIGTTQAAAQAFKVSGEAISHMAHARAHPGPVRIDGRDFCREALEEAADGRNYVCWLILHLTYSGHRYASEAMVHLGLALGAFAYAFHELELARKLLGP